MHVAKGVDHIRPSRDQLVVDIRLRTEVSAHRRVWLRHARRLADDSVQDGCLTFPCLERNRCKARGERLEGRCSYWAGAGNVMWSRRGVGCQECPDLCGGLVSPFRVAAEVSDQPGSYNNAKSNRQSFLSF